MTITFVTLLLGLVTGTQAVEIAAAPSVAAIEIVLDGTTAARIAAPPWKAAVDFGAPLRPHRLTAVAYGADGRAIARIEQWVNAPRPEVEATLVPLASSAKDGRIEAVRLAWGCPGCGPPRTLEVTLDGSPLPAADPARIPLPRLRDRSPHIVQAQLTFDGSRAASAELVVGTPVADSDVGLTAVALSFDGKPIDDPARIGPMLRAGERPVEVLAIESGAARVIFVRDPALPVPPTRWAGWLAKRRRGMLALSQLPASSSIRLLDPRPVAAGSGASAARVFDVSRPYADARGSALDLLTADAPPAARAAHATLAEAVAVAAQRVARENRRRAVILVSGSGEDRSAHSPADVDAYLRALGVPLFVWAVESMPPEGWPVTGPAKTFNDLAARWAALTTRLEHQRIVWVRGRYLPGEITVHDPEGKVRLAGD